VLTAHDFVWRQARGHYDLPVYQAANSRAHDFIWPYLLRWPGLTVLRDARLHHARAGALVSRGLHAAYREVFAWNHPDRSRDLAELGVHGFPGAYFYLWPMRRDVMEASRLIASHGPGVVEKLRREHPGRPVTQIALGHGREDFDVSARRTRFRTTRGIPESAPVFGVFGRLTAERRVPQILRAFAAARLWAPDARLLLVGTLDPQLDVPADARALGVAEAVCLIAGAQGIAPGIAVGINDDEFDDAIAACDVAIAMQWPTALETLAPWLRALAARRATIILDLEHQRHVPALDPRIWRLHGPTSDFESGAEAKAITVAIDILDEEHSLRLAMRRLGTDAALRERLGTAGRAYWESAHTLARMTDDYERAINEALAQPVPSPNLPPSLRWDGTTRARALLEPFDLPLPF
jgi:glycosyltransferase involved in cell wall biosynthesis